MAQLHKKKYNGPISAAFCASLFIFMVCSNLYAASINLAWNANTESDLAGYRIYYGTSPGNYSSSRDTATATSYTLSNLIEGKTYYIAMSAFDTSRNESQKSTEISGVARGEEQTVYEDAEDGLTTCWTVYDNLPSGAQIENVYDSDRQSNVIELTGSRRKNGYQLSLADGSKWYNETQTVIEWSMKYAEAFTIYIDLETTAGHRYLQYNPVDLNLLGAGEFVFFGLGSDVIDGQWHTIVRDLQADLNLAQPGVIILEVNGFLIRGSGMVDDIRLISSSTIYDGAEAACSDSFDNDGDELIDCADPDCAQSSACSSPAEEMCDDFIDNDGDELIDCADPDCAQSSACSSPAEEICDDSIDNDGDNLEDCDDPDCAVSCGGTVYEDAEDGTTTRWVVYDNEPAGAAIGNIYDRDRKSNVIELRGSGWDNGYQLMGVGGNKWHNSIQVVIEWSMSYAEDFVVYVDLETTAGHRYLQYMPVNSSQLAAAGEYVFFELGTEIMDGQWHTIVRDLQADLNLAQPGVIILEVNGFLIRGSGMVDDIKMLNAIPGSTVYEDAEDGTTTRWVVYDNEPAGAAIGNIYDRDRKSNVIELRGTGWNNGYQLMGVGGNKWHNSIQVVIEWSMSYSEDFTVYVDLETTAGHRYLKYDPVNFNLLGTGEYVFFGLSIDAMDGQWHTFVRDLQADLNLAQPGVTIIEVNGFLIRGSGMVDDIKLLD